MQNLVKIFLGTLALFCVFTSMIFGVNMFDEPKSEEVQSLATKVQAQAGVPFQNNFLLSAKKKNFPNAQGPIKIILKMPRA